MKITHSPFVTFRLTGGARFLALLSLGATMACTVEQGDDSPPEPTTGTVQQSFVGGAVYGQIANITPTTLSFNNEEITYQTHTCFLTAVHGNMDSHNQTVDVRVRPWYGDNKTWQLTVAPDSGNPLEGTAACVRRVTNRTAEVQYSGGAAEYLGSADPALFPNRRCFLTGVRVREKHETFPEDFATAGDYLKIFKGTTSDGRPGWFLGGSGNVAGFARCVDVVDHGDAWATGGTGTITLAYNPADACFLTEVGGPFRTNSYSNGVSVFLDPGVQEWKLEADGSKRAGARCAR